MRILSLGAGAVGGYFGARLTPSGRDVTFLARVSRVAQLRSTGNRKLTIDGSTETAPVHAISIDDLDSTYDFVLVAAKSFAPPTALAEVAPTFGTDAVVIPILGPAFESDPPLNCGQAGD